MLGFIPVNGFVNPGLLLWLPHLAYWRLDTHLF